MQSAIYWNNNNFLSGRLEAIPLILKLKDTIAGIKTYEIQASDFAETKCRLHANFNLQKFLLKISFLMEKA